MKFFPLTVIDNFFEAPAYVANLARTAKYPKKGKTFYPGVKSRKQIHELDEQLYNWTMMKIVSLFWDTDVHQVVWQGYSDFHKIEGNGGYAIHTDDKAFILAGLVYLNEEPEPETGTTFYELKKEHKFYKLSKEYLDTLSEHHAGLNVPDYDQTARLHRNKFNETMKVQSKFNRCVFYSPEVWHSATTYGDEDRYTLRFFVTNIRCQGQNYPLVRGFN